jgi:hypothetical protein
MADRSQTSGKPREQIKMRIDFVDLTHWDEDPINFNAAKADGCLGVIFKVTESDNYADPTTNRASKRRARPVC